MRLKKLKIVGFKSFADRVVIDFDADIIGVVGPNGCGKSNIVDAFRWVMGEQSAKSMRGSSMHDVLFAGTQKRHALNMAEVSVTLSDVGESLATPYDEVVVTRRLYRDGESGYLINRQPVRLRDVQHLFLGSGIGKNAFSIFEQGKIDRIINLPPTSRRAIFDEAAGIGRFLERKKETVRKLSQVEENYNRLRDVHGEVEKQARQLKRQAAQAKHFQENKAELEALEKAILITRLKKINHKGEGFVAELEALEKQLKDECSKLALLEEKMSLFRQELKEQEAKATTDKEQLYKVQSSAKIQAAEYARQQERLEELKKREKELLQQISEVSERRAGYMKEIELKQGHSKGELEQLQAAFKELQKQYQVSWQKESELRQQAERLTFQIEASKKEQARKLEAVNRLEKESGEKKNVVETLSVQIDALQAELKKSAGKLKTTREQEQEMHKQLQELTHSITKLAAKEQALQEDVDGFPKSAQSLLLAARDAKSPIYNMVSELSRCLFVESQADLQAVLAFAKAEKLHNFPIAVRGKKEEFRVISVPGEEQATPFRRAEELKELAASLKQKRVERGVLEGKWQALVQVCKTFESEHKAIEEKRRKLEMTLVQENFAYRRALSDLEKEQKKEVTLVGEAELTQVQENLAAVQAQSIELKEQVATSEGLYHDAQHVAHAIQVLEAKEQESGTQEKRASDELEKVRASCKLCETALLSRKDHSEVMTEKLDRLHARSDESERDLAVLRQQHEEVETHYLAARDEVQSIEKKKHGLDVTLAEDKTLKSELVHELAERHEMTLQEGLESEILLDNLGESEKRVRHLRTQVEQGGMVNLTAIDEYQVQQERFESLDVQLKDLEETKQELEKIIVQLDGESRKLFKSTFAVVRENFKKNFAILFKGGEADLRFTESRDVLEAGVEIIAKPPGKQMRSISLLSGGEKCLTALALLFSIFEVKPAPFCILDEVDAPLDDSNIGRFTEMLKQYVQQTQFIVVTHNKKTMSVADILIGVSMEEKGVSKLISLAFAKTTAAT